MISVIVPIYNEEKYLNQCLESLVNQTYRDLEIILIDDGSTDSSPIICETYRKIDPRIQIIHKSNEGLARAVKDGVMAASGEYVGFVDSDDWISLDMYEILYKTAVYHQADIIQCRICLNEEKKENQPDCQVFGEENLQDVANNMLTFFQSDNPMFVPCRGSKLFRTQLIKKNLEFYHDRICYGEDINFFFIALKDAVKIVALPHMFLYHYRKNCASITNNYKKNLRENNNLLLSTLKNLFALTGWKEEGLEVYEIYLRYQEMKNLLHCPYAVSRIHHELICIGNTLELADKNWSARMNLFYESWGGRLGIYLLKRRYYRIAILLSKIKLLKRKWKK